LGDKTNFTWRTKDLLLYYPVLQVLARAECTEKTAILPEKLRFLHVKSFFLQLCKSHSVIVILLLQISTVRADHVRTRQSRTWIGTVGTSRGPCLAGLLRLSSEADAGRVAETAETSRLT
jgi:hypothetical protein